MTNLGGHDLPSLLEAFEIASTTTARPCFIAYTIKGFGLPLAGHKDNHAGLMTPAQMEGYRASAKVRPGHEWDQFEGLRLPAAELERFLDVGAVQRRGHAPLRGADRSRCRQSCRRRRSRPCRPSRASA